MHFRPLPKFRSLCTSCPPSVPTEDLSISEILQREFGSSPHDAPIVSSNKFNRAALRRLSKSRQAFVQESLVAVNEIIHGDEAQDKGASDNNASVRHKTVEDGAGPQTIIERGSTNTEIIRLLMDRANSRSWLELDKDMRNRRIELKPSQVAWVLRVQKHAKKAWDFFKWAASRPGYKHDSTCYAVMIEMLGRLSEHNLLEDLLSEMERNGTTSYNISTINTLIGVYAASDRIDKAEQFYLKLGQLGLRPNTYTYKCMLQAFAKAGKPSKAFEVYRTAQLERQPLDNISYNMLLDALSKDHQVEAVCNIFKDIRKNGGVVDVYTYTILIRTLGQEGMFGKALELFDEMAASGIEPNKYTYNNLLCEFANKDRVEDGMNLFKKMLKHGVDPDFVTYQSIVKLLCKGRQSGGAFEVLKLLKEKAARKEAYESFIKVLAKMGYVREVQMLFQQMQDEGVKPIAAVYLCMIDMLCRAAEADEALVIMRAMEQNGYVIPKTTCNSIIAALRKDNQFQAAYDLFTQMKEKGPSPDVVTYNSLIAGLAKAGKLELAENLFEDMQKFGCMPNVVSFNSVIHSFARLGDADSVRRLLQLMQDKEITPDVVTYNCVIECFGRAGKPNMALKVFNEMKEKGCSPSFVTYNNVLLSLAKAGLTESVLSLFQQMKDQGFMPDAMTFTILSRVYEDSPHLDKSQLRAEIKSAGLAYELMV